MGELTDLEKEILDFEHTHTIWKFYGRKQAEVRDRFDMSDVRYFQVLRQLIRRPEALAYRPAVVRRLQRLEEQRRAQRRAPLTPA